MVIVYRRVDRSDIASDAFEMIFCEMVSCVVVLLAIPMPYLEGKGLQIQQGQAEQCTGTGNSFLRVSL